ncbi:hypothetical protein D3C73_1338870 [compost metagenome]
MRQLRRFDFDELQVLGVLDHIEQRRGHRDAVLELDQLGRLQHQQRAGAVGRVVGNGDLAALRQFVKRLQALGIDAHLLHHGGRHRHQLVAARLVL